jgi:hypothetical protein
MRKISIVFSLLVGLLSGCQPAAPTSQPAATAPSIVTPVPIQAIPPASTSTPATLPPGSFSLEGIAQLGGSVNGIVVVGDMAYVGMGPRLAGIDIRDHAQPHLVMQSKPLPGLVTRLLQISEMPAARLLVNAGRTLVLVDISDPASLKQLGSLELDGAITALVWDEGSKMAYVGGSIYHHPGSAGYTGFIAAINISPNNLFQLINTVAIPERPLSLALAAGGLFAGAEGSEGGLYHVKAEKNGALSTPVLVIPSTPESPLQPLQMQVIGQTLYLSYRAMEAYDVTNPEKPVQIWKKISGNGDVLDGFALSGERIYFFGWTILSESAHGVMTLPEPVAGSPVGRAASIAAMHQGDFLVAYQDLEIYASNNPAELQLVGSFQSPLTNAFGAEINAKAAFVLDLGAGDGSSQVILRILSLPDLKPLGQVTSEISNKAIWYRAPYISLEGDRLYLASLDRVWVYDISHLQPMLVGKAGIAGGYMDAITALQLGGKRLLVVSQEASDHTNVLKAYDLTDLQKPADLGSPLTLDQGIVLRMIWNEPALAVLLDTSYHAHQDRLYVVNFDGNALKLKDSIELAEFTGQMADDARLILLADLGEQASQPSASIVEREPLKLLVQIPLPEAGMGVAVMAGKALVLTGYYYGFAQLLVYDVRAPADPRQVAAMDVAVGGSPQVSILASGSSVVLANGQGGVEVIRIKD